MKLAFLGTGAMGTGIASNLLKACKELYVWNIQDSSWANALALARDGATACAQLPEAVLDADYIGMSLTSDAPVRHVCSHILPLVKPGAIIFDCSTISPSCSMEMASLFAGRGIYYLDTPVSGGIEGALAGTLTIMAGGDSSAYEKLSPILDSCTSSHVYMGGPGAGQTTKLINQMLTAINQAAVCEAMALARHTCLDLDRLYRVLSQSWGRSAMLERSVEPHIIPGDYSSAARIFLMLKDLRLAIDMGKQMEFSLPLTELTTGFFEAADKQGLGQMDHSAIIKIMETADRIS